MKVLSTVLLWKRDDHCLPRACFKSENPFLMKKRSIFWFEISLYYPDSEGSLVNYSFLFPFINNFDCDSWLFFDIFSFGALLIKFNYHSITYIKLRYTNCLETDAKVSVKAILVHLL